MLDFQRNTRITDVLGHLTITHPHVGIGGIRHEPQGHLASGCSNSFTVRQINTAIQAVPRQRAIHRPRVEVADTKPRRQRLRDRGLSRTRGAVDSNRDTNT